MLRITRLHFYSAISAALLLSSCGSKNAGNSPSAVDGDTGATQSHAEKPVELKALPDTAYESVGRLNFSVDIFDSEIDPVISDYSDLYTKTPGAFTFRKGSRRDADFGGTVKGRPSKIAVEWQFKTDFRGTWGGGSGWTGQPLYVEWPDSCISRFDTAGLLKPGFSGKEIIVGSLCGKVYFIDFVTGNASRDAIDGRNPIKGTVSLDPSLNGNLYVGQGIPDNSPFGAYVINLYKHDITHFFDRDSKAWRGWGAYDSSAIRVGQFLFRPGENGTLYKFLIGDGKLTLQSTLRYRQGGIAPGMESSMSVYINYGFVADNSGNLVCVNLDTMHPVWSYAMGDDTDSTPVVIEEDGHPYVYTGCEIDKQGTGTANYVKIDALTGEVVWRLQVDGRRADVGEKHFDGGFYGSSLPGKGNCGNLMFVNCVLNTNGQNGVFLAVNRDTGEIAYTVKLKYYAWSSPVGFLNENGEMFVVTGDCTGNLYLIDGLSGDIIITEKVGNNFESSPVVHGNTLVVGSRGEYIYKVKIE